MKEKIKALVTVLLSMLALLLNLVFEIGVYLKSKSLATLASLFILSGAIAVFLFAEIFYFYIYVLGMIVILLVLKTINATRY